MELDIKRSSIFYNHKIRYSWHGRNAQGKYEPSRMFDPIQWLWRFPIWCRITWDRGGIRTPIKNRYHQSEELIYQIGKNMKFYQKKGEDSFKTIWRIPPSKNNGHVCTFPEKLVENCIFPTTDIGDTIIDPYLGSGTTAIVAIKHGRRFIGIENDHKYFATACRNIQKAEDERDKAEKEGTFNPDGLERWEIAKEKEKKKMEGAIKKAAKESAQWDLIERQSPISFKPSRTLKVGEQHDRQE